MKTALIIGAGPAGLTAALELLKKGDIHPIVVEQENFVGGISRTVEYNGNRMGIDLGTTVFCVEILSLHKMVSKIAGTGVAFIFNYTSKQFYIFSHR